MEMSVHPDLSFSFSLNLVCKSAVIFPIGVSLSHVVPVYICIAPSTYCMCEHVRCM